VTIRVLGIDPGTAITGYGIVEPCDGRVGRLIECGVIRTHSKDQLCNRLRDLYEGLTDVIARHEPTVVAVEGIFYARNVRTTVILSHTRGAVLLAAAHAGLDVAEFSPAVVKKTVVGAGGARKAQIGYMVQQLLNLKTPPTPNDAADGIAIALTYLLTRHY
jgi:crossover junction endodeoxyribonuclease RuvC